MTDFRLLVLTLLLPLSIVVRAEEPQRPNIIVILSDDMGFSDIGCYGGEIETPALDALAKDGLRFTQFYNTGRCCPTRACLLTGLYPHQAGVGHMMNDRGHPGYRGDLNRNCVTMAEVLKSAGYRTYMSGKWHVTKHTSPDGPKHNWPLQRGFDRFYGTITGAGSFFDPGTLTRDNTMISPAADPEYKPETYYYTDAISDHAIRFVSEHGSETNAEEDRPFFLYLTYTAAHWPMHALPEDIEKYAGKYDGGYAPIHAARLAKLKELGIYQDDWTPAELVGDWSEVEHKEWEARCMEVYAAMVDRMDHGIGRLVETLRERGELDNTLIFYMQDNGGCAEGVGRNGKGVRASKPTLPTVPEDTLQLGIYPDQTRDGYPVLRGPNVMPGPADTYIAYGRNWANVSNTPFREYKHYVHEGGIATPLIAHWPEGLKQTGELNRTPSHLIDIMATCVDVAGAEYPQERASERITPLEGVSLAPAFTGTEVVRAGPLFWEHEGNRAIRDGRWKLVSKWNKPWELYDIEADRPEQNNLADTHPERVATMSAVYDAWTKRANVAPVGTWRGTRKKKN